MATERKKPVRPAKPSKPAAKPAPKKGRITAKRVQATDDLPPPVPPGLAGLAGYAATPEPDDEPWGKDGLTLKQRRFVRAYCGRAAGNATKAAELAGYRSDNRDALRVTACENLTKPNVQRAISRRLSRQGGGRDWTLAGIVELARSSMADFVSLDGNGQASIDLGKAREAAALGAIKKLRIRPTDAGTEITVETYSRLEALKTLAKVHGDLVERVDHTGTVRQEHALDFDAYARSFEQYARDRLSGPRAADNPGNGN